jgi:flagella basal body P-ring formation protein FlgA
MIFIVVLALLSLGQLRGQPCLTVDGEWVTAGDVADRIPRFGIEDPDTRLIRTPFPGARRLLGPATLPGAEPGQDIEPFCVERRLRAYSHEAFFEAIERSLAGKHVREIGFELTDYERDMLPSGRLEFLIQALPTVVQTHPDDPVLWRGKLVYAEGRSVPVWVRLRLWIEDEVCVLVRDVARGEDLKGSDCRVSRVKYAPFAPPPLRDPSALERTTALRRLTAGEPIYQALLVRRPDVEAGKTVELRVINGGAQLKFQVKAAGSARTGESVAVTNPANGKRLEGQVVGKDMVEVRLK